MFSDHDIKGDDDPRDRDHGVSDRDDDCLEPGRGTGSGSRDDGPDDDPRDREDDWREVERDHDRAE